jgi:hypothetical protein
MFLFRKTSGGFAEIEKSGPLKTQMKVWVFLFNLFYCNIFYLEDHKYPNKYIYDIRNIC